MSGLLSKISSSVGRSSDEDSSGGGHLPEMGRRGCVAGDVGFSRDFPKKIAIF